MPKLTSITEFSKQPKYEYNYREANTRVDHQMLSFQYAFMPIRPTGLVITNIY